MGEINMKIGMIRHFKVDYIPGGFITSKEIWHCEELYNTSEVTENKVDLGGITWNRCYSSDLYRAKRTSKRVFQGEIIESHLIREVTIDPVINTERKLPYLFWDVASRFQWYFNLGKSQRELRRDTEKRANEFLDSLKYKEDENILIVTHGLFMHVFQRELRKRGFKGKVTLRPKNGTLYVYSKK